MCSGEGCKTQCCCCIPIRTGVLTIGGVYIALYLLQIVLGIVYLATPPQADFKKDTENMRLSMKFKKEGNFWDTLGVYMIVTGLIHVVVSVLLIVGVIVSVRYLLLPWPIWTGLSLLIPLIFTPFGYPTVGINVLTFPLDIYFIVVVSVYFHYFDEEEDE